MLAVENMNETVDFYSTVLGFQVSMSSEEYSVMEIDGHTIHLMLANSKEVMEAVRGHADFYIEVSDLDKIWKKASQFKDKFQTKAPFIQPYGMREFHISDPNECLVFVGQRIEG